MKLLFFVLIASFVVVACQQVEFEYSCDPVINDFVIENKVELSQIHVEELATYEVPLQKAIFRSWSPDKKRSAWLEKLRYVQNSTSFSTRESDHLQKLIDHISEDYFLDDKIQKANANNLEFADEWMSFAKTDLGWTDQFVAFLVYRLYTTPSQFDSEQSMLKSINIELSTNSETGTCNCNTSSDFCPGSMCSSTGCTSSSGCGWLWSETCNGNC